MSQAEANTDESQPQVLEPNYDNVFTTAFMTFVKDHIDLCEEPSRIIKKGETRWRRLPKYKKLEYLQKALEQRKRRLKLKCKPKRNSCHEELPTYIKCFDSIEDRNNSNEDSQEDMDVMEACGRRRKKPKKKRRSPCCPRKKVPCKANRRRRRKRSCRR